MLAWMTKALTAAVANEQRIALAKRAAASHHHARPRPARKRRSR